MPAELIVAAQQLLFWAIPKAIVLVALYFVIRKAITDALAQRHGHNPSG